MPRWAPQHSSDPSKQKDFSLASKVYLKALLLRSPQIPRSRTWCRDWPLQPTPTGSQRDLHSFLQHSVTRSAYLVTFLSWASSIWPSQGIVNSIKKNTHTICLDLIRTMFGLRPCSWVPRSTRNYQSLQPSPGLWLMGHFVGCCCFLVMIHSATACRTLWWHRRYRLRMCPMLSSFIWCNYIERKLSLTCNVVCKSCLNCFPFQQVDLCIF